MNIVEDVPLNKRQEIKNKAKEDVDEMSYAKVSVDDFGI